MDSVKARIEKLEGKPCNPRVRFVQSTRSVEEARRDFERNHDCEMLDFYETRVDETGRVRVTLHEFRRVRRKDGTLNIQEKVFPIRPTVKAG